MAAQGLEPDLQEGICASAREILETMASMVPESVTLMTEPPSWVHQVTGLLGFTGTTNGTVVVGSSEKLAKAIAAKMLMMAPEELTNFDEAADAFGEVVNMLAGNFKNAWVTKGNEMNLSVPTVIHEGSVHVQQRAHAIVTSIRAVVAGEHLDITIMFEGN
ncbi:MAG: chemotaxis protein CheX [Planctomycetota bacterium]